MSPQPNYAKHRVQRVKMAAGWAMAAKVASLLVTVLSIPLAISTLGAERFGIYITITTFFSLFSFLDGGIGNAVINMIADQRVAKNDHRLRQVAASAYLLLSIIAIAGLFLSVLLALMINWRWAISLPKDITEPEIILSALIVGCLFFINMPLGLAAKIRQGLQETHFNSCLDILSYCVILAGTLAAWYFQASLNWFLMAFALGPVFANGTNTLLLGLRNDVLNARCYTFASKQTVLNTLSSGSLFVGLQACAALAFQTDALIVSHLLGLEATAELGLVNRMFLIATSVTGFVTAPLWPAFRDATMRGEIEWVRRVFSRALQYSLLISLVITLPLMLAHKPLIAVWSNSEISPHVLLVLAVFIWTNMLVAGSLTTSLLNGLNAIRLQLIAGVVMVIMNLPLSIVLTQHIGPSGVVYGSIISYALCVLIPFCLIIPGQFDRFEAHRHTVLGKEDRASINKQDPSLIAEYQKLSSAN